MSKVEELALKLYPVHWAPINPFDSNPDHDRDEYDTNGAEREAFMNGYYKGQADLKRELKL